MGQLIRLSDANFDANNARPLSDFGFLPDTEQAGIFKLKTSAMTNDGGAGAAQLSFDGTATGGDAPSWASGVLTAPAPASGSSYYNSGVVIEDPTQWTVATIMRAPAGLMNLFQGSASGNAYIRTNGQQIQTNAVSEDILFRAIDEWLCLAVAFTASGVKAIGPRGGLKSYGYSNVPTGADGTMRIGSTASGQYAWRGDYVFFGVWNRSFTDQEMLGLRDGMKVFAETKNIRIA